MTSTGHISTQRSRFVALVGAAAIAFGAMLVTATTAEAEPVSESTIKSECKAAGGTYTTYPGNKKGVVRISSCTYKDINGDTYTDDYYGGEYAGTSSTGPA